MAQETMTYEQALKAFKAEWADKRKEERKEKLASKKAEERATAKESVKNALAMLNAIDNVNAKNELTPAIKRLEMFLNDEKYTRNKGV